MAATAEQVETATEQHGAWVMQQPGVNGCSAGVNSHGAPAMVVFCDQTPDDVKQRIRDRVGVPVEFIEGFQMELRAES